MGKLTKNKKSELARGVSIVETLIYIAILVFILVIVIVLLFNLIGSQKSIQAAKSIENSATLSLERIIRDSRNASSINTSSSVFGSSPGTLVLNTTDSNGNPKTIEFFVTSSQLHVKENGVDQGSLTQSDVTVTNLKFTLITGTNSTGVRTEITLQSGTSTYLRTDSFYTTNILRTSS